MRTPLIPGHQIVGEIVEGGTPGLPIGTRVGVSWVGGTDGNCPYCLRGLENLCDSPVFTGYSVDGGYAEYAVARADFVFPLPASLDDLHAAPLLCAGVIGFRSLRVAGVEPGDNVGLFGFGSSASLAIAVLAAWKCKVYVSTRGESHRRLAVSLGAAWVGGEDERPPVELDRAVTFAPSGDVVIAALSSLRKSGVVAINAIHLDRIPEFDYDRLLWGERQIRSVANMTRADARDFLDLAGRLGLQPKVTAFPLQQANEALAAVKSDSVNGCAVIVPQRMRLAHLRQSGHRRNTGVLNQAQIKTRRGGPPKPWRRRQELARIATELSFLGDRLESIGENALERQLTFLDGSNRRTPRHEQRRRRSPSSVDLPIYLD